MWHPQKILVALSIVLTCLILVILEERLSLHTQQAADTPNASQAPRESRTSKETTRYWQTRLETTPDQAEAIYQEYLAYAQSLSEKRRHSLAHMFGRSLYLSMQNRGLRHCGPDFGFGCYHGFFGAFISRNGADKIKTLDDECLQAFGRMATGCQHGIGHGLMAYFANQGIVPALTNCGQTTRVHKLFGCPAGVFMEYNYPVIADDDHFTQSLRAFDPAQVYQPCLDSEIKEWRLACIYEQANWWRKSGVTTKTANQYCAKLSAEIKHVCLLGLGRSLYEDKTQSSPAAECAHLPAPPDKITCRAGIAWSIISEKKDNYLAQAIQICNNNENCLNEAWISCNYLTDRSKQDDCLQHERLSAKNNE